MTDNKFLHQVASYFCNRATADNMAELIMVVPNRRSGLFLKKHFCDELAQCGHPVMLPRFHTMTRVVEDFAQCPCMPRNEQLFLLFEAYREVLASMGRHEQQREFDRFAFWGDIIINDFNDIDSSLANASDVFRNLKGLKEIAADFLTPDQKDIVRRLWGESIYTRPDDGSFWLNLDHGSDNTEAKTRFIQLWELLGPLYKCFHHKLEKLGLSTEGLQQRLAVRAARNKSEFRHRYVFVGFSAITNAEFALMDALRNKGAASFFWDFGMLPADTPMPEIIKRFSRLATTLPAPSDFDLSPADWPEEIECVAVPSNSGQAKYLTGVLRQWYTADADKTDSHTDDDGMLDTAVIVPDETLLPVMVLSLPAEVKAVNISLRMPYRNTAFASLLSGIISMQLRARLIHGEYNFFYEDVERILSHPHLRAVAGDKADSVLREINLQRMYNIAADDLQQMLPEIGNIFIPVKDLGSIEEIHRYTIGLIGCLENAFRNLSQNSDLIEFRMLAYFREQLDELSRLISKYGVTMNENTYFTLFERLLAAKRIDLHGSPLKGLQMMGVLETRALDFNKVIIMSVNERIFPRRNYLRTMIPDSLRRGYGLNTESEAEAAYTYYFYRLITGASNVKLLYDNRSASLGAGEVSRFVSQLRYLHGQGHNLVFSTLELPSDSNDSRVITITKDAAVMALLDEFKPGGNRYISASALKTYLTCPLKFYLKEVRRLSTDDDVKPYINAADYGTVVHSVMEHLYKPFEGKAVTAGVIDDMLHTNGMIMDAVQKQMSDFLNRDRIRRNKKPRELNTESKILCRVIHHFVTNVLAKERDTYCNPSFTYICAEHTVKSPPAWKISDSLSINFKMKIDRIDSIAPGHLRFIDYKTGADAVKAGSIDSLFTDSSCSAIFQLLLYCEAYGAMADNSAKIMPVVYNFTDITANGVLGPVTVGKESLDDYRTVSDRFMPLLRSRLEDLFNPDIPFGQCVLNRFNGPCKHCAFADLCGR